MSAPGVSQVFEPAAGSSRLDALQEGGLQAIETVKECPSVSGIFFDGATGLVELTPASQRQNLQRHAKGVDALMTSGTAWVLAVLGLRLGCSPKRYLRSLVAWHLPEVGEVFLLQGFTDPVSAEDTCEAPECRANVAAKPRMPPRP